jgi:hypothetical protein
MGEKENVKQLPNIHTNRPAETIDKKMGVAKLIGWTSWTRKTNISDSTIAQSETDRHNKVGEV